MSENDVIKVMMKSLLWAYIILSVLTDRLFSITGLRRLCGSMGEVNQGGETGIGEGHRNQPTCPELVTL